MTRRIIGFSFLTAFLLSIPFANHWLKVHGLWNAPLVGYVPSAVWVVAFAFVFRDIAQLFLGRSWTWAAIVVGALLSWWLATPTFALASGLAFAWSESTDALIFTPLANRGTTRLFLLGVVLSGYAASVVDSVIFIRIAFHTYHGWWQLTVAKIFFVMLATPIAWLIRKRFADNNGQRIRSARTNRLA